MFHKWYYYNTTVSSMVVVAGLAPIWHQNICNHHADTSCSGIIIHRIHIIVPLLIAPQRFHKSIWWLLMAWHPNGCQDICKHHGNFQKSVWWLLIFKSQFGCQWPGAHLAPGHLQPPCWYRLVHHIQGMLQGPSLEPIKSVLYSWQPMASSTCKHWPAAEPLQ